MADPLRSEGDVPDLSGAAQKAATVIVSLESPAGTMIALAAVDPRWRLDREGRHEGIQALNDGVLTPLRLSGLKFIGGLVDDGEDPRDAALRELAEEAGQGLAGMVADRGMREVYRMLRGLEWSSKAKVGITYLHAAMRIDESDLQGLFEPGDDCLAILLFRPEQVALDTDGYFVSGAPLAAYWRNAYVPIPYGDWLASDAQVVAYEAYNAAGRSDPFAGLDVRLPDDSRIALFCPEDASVADVLRDDDLRTGRPLPDGAILAHVMRIGPA